MNDHEKAMVLALVHAHIHSQPEYYSWVRHHVKHNVTQASPHAMIVGGHYRRKALYLRTLQALACTTKFNDVSETIRLYPPVRAFRKRRGEDGVLVRREHRQFEFD